MDDAVVLGVARTPFGRLGGSLASIATTQLGAIAVRAAVERSGIAPEVVDAVYLGLCLPSGGMTAARMAALQAGLPLGTLSLTIDRACCSAMTAVAQAAASINHGDAKVIVAGGMENMSRTPKLAHDARFGRKVGDVVLEDPLVIRNPYLDEPMARYTGTTALRYGVDRHAQDEWALRSQERWRDADAGGRLREEIVPVEVGTGSVASPFERDEQPRPNTTLEALARLPTVYGSPTVTAGNAPGLNDGATALVVSSWPAADDLGVRPLASIVRAVSIAGEPRESVRLPADAINHVLSRAGIGLRDVDLFEINEAFAATAVVSTQVLADGDPVLLEKIRSRTNVNGGAVAIGHPIGATGARLVMTLVLELRRRGGGIGVAAICGGVGQADAVVVRVD